MGGLRIIGAGIRPFVKPDPGRDYAPLGAEAARLALADAGIQGADCGAAVVGYCYGEPTSGHRVANDAGVVGAPVYAVNSNCSSGSSAIALAAQLLRGGSAECALVVGFEKMERGGLSHHYLDRTHPQDPHFEAMRRMDPEARGERARLPNGQFAFKNAWTENCTKLFCSAAREHMRDCPELTVDRFADIARKNRRHGALNPNALLQRALRPEPDSRVVCPPLTASMCAPMADGAAAVVMCTEQFAARLGAAAVRRAVALRGVALVSDTVQPRAATSARELVGSEAARRAARAALAQAGVSVGEVDLIELHDCYASAEAMLYEALGLCGSGAAAAAVRSFEWRPTEQGGELCWLSTPETGPKGCVVNPSGGLLSKGHPIGATGVAQCVEVVTQLRGAAGRRQVPGARVAMQHNFGLGGGAVVAVYSAPGAPRGKL
eukprot:TRINITY_DN21162_c0_g1_i1.p1 TRINITY_DN21162_c0_g1~~TRINITY_DN21162_c0_g1_i1.p1  ORF type:complete len:461 (+),score=153.37 TRINITY_DN21162_c0_g1_i1:79-1383(+)